MNARSIYQKAHGAVPEGAHVHHLCGRADCSNEDHLIALLPHDHAKFHRYLCDTHQTARVVVKERKSETFWENWTEEERANLDAAVDAAFQSESK